MSTLSSSVTSEAPTRSPPRPRGLLGARVARAGADRTVERRSLWVLIETQLMPSLERALWSVECADERVTVTDGAQRFESAVVRSSALAPSDDSPASTAPLERAIERVEAAAIERWSAFVERDAGRAFAALEMTTAYAQSVIDEQPTALRPTAAKRAIAVLRRSEAQLQPELRISVRAVLSVRDLARVARWRLSSDAGWCWIETESRARSAALHARCARCDERHPAHALCARCLEDRCARCARRCARCRRTACVACAPEHRCPHCELDAIEIVDDP